jgi:hypothetical protein
MVTTEDIANQIRDLINWVEIKKNEELEAGEGKKIEADTASELQNKLREMADALKA